MSEITKPKKSILRLILPMLPLFIFLGLALIFYKQLSLGGASSDIPSALIGKPVPVANMEPLEGLKIKGEQVPVPTPEIYRGKVTVVNVFASWCVPCRAEHPQMIELAKDSNVQMVGINYKDSTNNAVRFLGGLGNPYTIVGVDGNGRASIEWGVYGVPETFIIGKTGLIEYKHVGPISAQALEEKIKPVIARLAAQE